MRSVNKKRLYSRVLGTRVCFFVFACAECEHHTETRTPNWFMRCYTRARSVFCEYAFMFICTISFQQCVFESVFVSRCACMLFALDWAPMAQHERLLNYYFGFEHLQLLQSKPISTERNRFRQSWLRARAPLVAYRLQSMCENILLNR